MNRNRSLGRAQCPRCGANAGVSAKTRPDGNDAMLIVLRCPKCRFVRNLGFTTERAVMITERKDQIIEAMKEEGNHYRRLVLYSELQRLQREEQIAELGL